MRYFLRHGQNLFPLKCGFRVCGMYPFDPTVILSKFPESHPVDSSAIIDSSYPDVCSAITVKLPVNSSARVKSPSR